MNALALKHVGKRFGATRALEDVSFAVRAGEIVGFVGPNGSGKSTTLRIVSGYIDPDVGRVEVCGREVSAHRDFARAQIGYMPESVPLYRDMRVAEYLAFRAALKGMRGPTVRARVTAVCEACGLAAEERRIIGHLSRGYRQRVGLADALIAEPPIVLLDEPTAGLDPVEVRKVRALIASLALRHTVIIASHVLADIEAMAARVIMLAAGHVVGDGTVAELRQACGMDASASLEDVFVALAHAAETPATDQGATGEAR